VPYITANDVRLYYQDYAPAAEAAGRAPIVLIHGSSHTGQKDWGAMAPCLAAAGYRVLVPDCRGHGQSDNPRLSYSFFEMAADTAAFVRALGFEQAHIIGHSNGGNVALVTLVEHPGVVATAVLQAANAWVSPDLVEKEPPLFDPERVAREAPGWMNDLQALHGPHHGPDYWRDLLRLTVHAIVTEPNYSPADLARVRRPVLVIQGAEDGVNAPARHAQYMAENIPGAELWLPAGVGHTVHAERPDEWRERVLDFLGRHPA
jgi:pimeloyl-ACP methyl ester carboxylesterase